ncbi:MAG: hypothetical protein WC405_16295 [Syntrophales bacterium]
MAARRPKSRNRLSRLRPRLLPPLPRLLVLLALLQLLVQLLRLLVRLPRLLVRLRQLRRPQLQRQSNIEPKVHLENRAFDNRMPGFFVP